MSEEQKVEATETVARVKSGGGVPNYGIARDFPLLWEQAQAFDFAERLGGCTSPLLAEIDAALRELWDARRRSRAHLTDGSAVSEITPVRSRKDTE
jgi:hypothetical protein